MTYHLNATSPVLLNTRPDRQRPEWHPRIYALLLLGLGLIYVILIPPFEAPDEVAHFLRAFSVAEGQLILKDHPVDLLAFYRTEMQRRPNSRTMPFLAKLDIMLAQQEARLPNLAFNTSLYSPLPYVFHALVMRIALFGTTSPWVMLYLCRLVSLVMFVGIVYGAIRMYPAGCNILFWMAATPMALAQAAVVNVDHIILGSTMLLMAASLGNTGRAGFVGVVLSASVMLLLTKLPYLPILLLPLAACRFQKQSARQRVVLLSTSVAVAGAALWQTVMITYGLLDASLAIVANVFEINVDLNPQRQLALIVRDPWGYAGVLYYTLSIHGLKYLHQLVGVLGTLDVPIPFALVVLWGVGSLAVVLTSPPPLEISSGVRILLGLTCLVTGLLTALAVTTAGYLLWMPVGAAEVNLQGRYFHAMLLLLLTGLHLIRPPSLMIPWGQWVPPAVWLLCMIINIGAFYQLGQL